MECWLARGHLKCCDLWAADSGARWSIHVNAVEDGFCLDLIPQLPLVSLGYYLIVHHFRLILYHKTSTLGDDNSLRAPLERISSSFAFCLSLINWYLHISFFGSKIHQCWEPPLIRRCIDDGFWVWGNLGCHSNAGVPSFCAQATINPVLPGVLFSAYKAEK